MSDFHDNIFYFYRGSRHPQRAQYDQQLEDNTTKALVNTLKHCDPAVAIKFLGWLGIGTTAGEVSIELQSATIGRERIRRASNRLLLGLVAAMQSNGDSVCDKLEGPVNGDSRPDAWLYGEDFVVLIESKVEDASLELNQMRGHFRKLQVGSRHRPRCLVRTWAQVHQFFKELHELNGKDKWLVEQFTEYLEYQGMTEFTGFEEWMFQFFVRDEQDAEDKKLIRRTMERFGEKVLHGDLQALDPSFYEERYVGNFGSRHDHFWVAFGPAGGPKVFVKKAHQTISLYDYGLNVFVNVRPPPIKMLRKRLHSEKQRFVEIVSSLPGPFHIQISELRMVRPRKSDDYPIATLEGGTDKLPHSRPYGLKDPNAAGFDHLETLLRQIPHPHFSLTRRIDRKQVLDLSRGSAQDLVEEVVRIMKAFHPLVEFING